MLFLFAGLFGFYALNQLRLNYAEVKNNPQILDAYDNKGLFLVQFFITSDGYQSPPGSFFLGSGIKKEAALI